MRFNVGFQLCTLGDSARDSNFGGRTLSNFVLKFQSSDKATFPLVLFKIFLVEIKTENKRATARNNLPIALIVLSLYDFGF